MYYLALDPIKSISHTAHMLAPQMSSASRTKLRKWSFLPNIFSTHYDALLNEEDNLKRQFGLKLSP